VVQALAHDDPPHVRPEGALAGRVRVAFAVGQLVVDAMRGHQKMGPPSSASVPQRVRKYSIHFVVL